MLKVTNKSFENALLRSFFEKALLRYSCSTSESAYCISAYEIWNIHQKVTRCFELERNATRELVNMRKAFPLIEQMKANITIFRNEVNDVSCECLPESWLLAESTSDECRK